MEAAGRKIGDLLLTSSHGNEVNLGDRWLGFLDSARDPGRMRSAAFRAAPRRHHAMALHLRGTLP